MSKLEDTAVLTDTTEPPNATAAPPQTTPQTTPQTPPQTTPQTARTTPETTQKASQKASQKEVNPAGDIPDDQAFVPYSPVSDGRLAAYTVSVPEGWARTDGASFTSFTDKLNTIRMEATPALAAPTTASVVTAELPAIVASQANVAGGKASNVTRKTGTAILLRYRRDSAPNDVTGKVVREDVERYAFWRAGTQVTFTLSGPVGADNVDPWKIVTDSFVWK